MIFFHRPTALHMDLFLARMKSNRFQRGVFFLVLAENYSKKTQILAIYVSPKKDSAPFLPKNKAWLPIGKEQGLSDCYWEFMLDQIQTTRAVSDRYQFCWIHAIGIMPYTRPLVACWLVFTKSPFWKIFYSITALSQAMLSDSCKHLTQIHIIIFLYFCLYI